MDEEELLRLLLVEDEEFHDEGRDCYLDEVIGRMRDNLGTASQDPLPGTERIVFGRRTAERIGSTVSAFGRNVLLVTGRSSAATGLRERVLAQLEEAGVGCTVFDGVGPNPLVTSVDIGADAAREAGCDCVLAVGGGSQMDAAKMIALVAGNGGCMEDYLDGSCNSPDASVLPVVAVPTTCGTGSEANPTSVLTDPVTRDKKGFRCANALPRVAIVDPVLMETMPRKVTASVTFDALCHLIEAYVSTGRTETSDILCRKGLSYMSECMIRANDDIRDSEALDKVSYAASIAGIAIFRAGVVAPHMLEHPMSGLRDIAHGTGLAIVAPELFRMSAPGERERFSEVSRLFGGSSEKDIFETISGVRDAIGLDTTLSEQGFEHDDIEWLTASAMRTAGSKNERNPVRLSEEDVRGVYERCFRSDQVLHGFERGLLDREIRFLLREPGAQRHGVGRGLVHEVLGLVGVRVDDHPGSDLTCHGADMTVRDVVPRASGDLQEDTVLLGGLGILDCDETGMCQTIYVGILHGGVVGTGGHGLGHGLAVDDDPFGAEPAGLLRDLADEPRGDVGDLHSGDNRDVVVAQLASLDHVGHHPLHVAHVHVVGDRDDVVPQDHRPAYEFGGDELPVAVHGVGVEVGSHWLLSQSSA